MGLSGGKWLSSTSCEDVFASYDITAPFLQHVMLYEEFQGWHKVEGAGSHAFTLQITERRLRESAHLNQSHQLPVGRARPRTDSACECASAKAFFASSMKVVRVLRRWTAQSLGQ